MQKKKYGLWGVEVRISGVCSCVRACPVCGAFCVQNKTKCHKWSGGHGAQRRLSGSTRWHQSREVGLSRNTGQVFPVSWWPISCAPPIQGPAHTTRDSTAAHTEPRPCAVTISIAMQTQTVLAVKDRTSAWINLKQIIDMYFYQFLSNNHLSEERNRAVNWSLTGGELDQMVGGPDRPGRPGRPKRMVRVYCEHLAVKKTLTNWSWTPTSSRA